MNCSYKYFEQGLLTDWQVSPITGTRTLAEREYEIHADAKELVMVCTYKATVIDGRNGASRLKQVQLKKGVYHTGDKSLWKP